VLQEPHLAFGRYFPFAACLTLALVAAPPASAQTAAYNNQCATGTLAACWSISITTTQVAAAATRIVVAVTNWQGTAGYPADPNVLSTINLWTAPGTGTGNSFVQAADMSGLIAISVNGATGWSATQDGFAGIRLSSSGITGGLAGCVAPPTISSFTVTSYWSTCGGGTLVFDFTIPTLWNVPAGVPVTLSAGSGALGSRCDLGVNNPAFTPGRSDPCGTFTPPTPPPTSVPEPEGWLLMASGLVGFVFVNRRRKDTRA
jgi:hypothetical protein